MKIEFPPWPCLGRESILKAATILARAQRRKTSRDQGSTEGLLAIIPGSESTFEFGMHDSKQVDGAERLDMCVVGKPDLIEAVLLWPIRYPP